MNDFKYDIYRYYGKYKENLKEIINRPKGLRYLKIYRKRQATFGKNLNFSAVRGKLTAYFLIYS